MYNIKDLVKVVNGQEFRKAAKEAYYFIKADTEEYELSLNDFISQLKARYIEMFLKSRNDGEKAQVYNAAKTGDVYFVNITEIFECEDISNARMGDFIQKATIKRIREESKNLDDPMLSLIHI